MEFMLIIKTLFGLMKLLLKLLLCIYFGSMHIPFMCCGYYVFCRSYPGPWKVLRRVRSSKYVCLHQQDTMPSLKEVALEILPTT